MTTAQPRIRPRTALLAALLLAAATVWASASPAAAHDELVSSDPAADATLEVLPDTLTLTFSGELLGGGDANEVQVTDAAGTNLGDGPAVVDGTTLTQPLTGDAGGSIQVLWRVVSSDGHPISGEFAFTVAGSPSPTTPATPAASAAPAETVTPGESAGPTPVPTPAAEQDPLGPLPWIIGVAILVLVIALVLYLLVVRPRRGRTGSEPSADR